MSQQEFEHYLTLLARMLKLTPTQRDAIADELRTHLEERLDELQQQGHDRQQAIALALDEFGDANALAHDFTDTLHRARQRRTRKRLMQTTAGTLIAAAVVTFVVMTLTPSNFQGTPTQTPVVADAPETMRTETAPYSNGYQPGGPRYQHLQNTLAQTRLNFDLHNALTSEAIATLAENVGVNLVWIGDDTDLPTITLQLQDVSGEEVLTLIRQALLQPTEAQAGDNVLTIRVLDEYEAATLGVETRIYDLLPILQHNAKARAISGQGQGQVFGGDDMADFFAIGTGIRGTLLDEMGHAFMVQDGLLVARVPGDAHERIAAMLAEVPSVPEATPPAALGGDFGGGGGLGGEYGSRGGFD